MGAKTPNKQLDRSSAISMKIMFVQKALKERTTSHFLRLQLARSRYQLMRIEDRMKADADRGDLRALVHRLQESQNSNEPVAKPLARQLILDAARNLTVGAKGGGFTTSTRSFWEVVRIWAAPKLYNFIMANFPGPQQRTVETWIQKKRGISEVKLTDEHFTWLSDLYESIMRTAGVVIPADEKLLVLAAEDETSIIDKLTYNSRHDSVSGSCGMMC